MQIPGHWKWMGLELEARFLADIAIIMLMALFLGYIASKLKQPAMLGYLFAGIVIGPFTSGLINNVGEIDALSKVGVSLLLFVVGLEFSPRKLKQVLHISAISGTFEMIFMLFIGTVTGIVLHWTLVEALFLGTTLMMSSTIVILKILNETGQINTLHGRLLIGKLIIEDIAAIIIITMISCLISTETSLLLRFLPLVLGIIFLVLVMTFGRRIFSKIIEAVSSSHSKELFLLTVFGICISVAVISEMSGLSLALGAFLAGIILSESEHHLDIMSQMAPLKDIFLIIFFVSIGMTIDPHYLLENPLPVVLIVSVLLLGKLFANTVPVRLLGYHPKTAVLVGFGMLQIGEFSFIIATLGLQSDLISHSVYSAIIATALVSMVFTPYAMRSAPGVYKKLQKRGIIKTTTEEPLDEATDAHEQRIEQGKKGTHVVVLGYAGVAIESLACMDLVKYSYTVVDYDPKKIQMMKDKGIDCVYGDASNEDVLKWAGVDYAKLVMVVISDTIDAELAIEHCHMRNPGAYIIARAYGNYDKDRIKKFANDVVISEEVAGKRMAWHVLRTLGLEEDAIKKDIEIVDRALVSVEEEDVCK